MNTDEALADKALAPLIKHAEKNPGTIARVTERLTKLMKTKVHRQLVEKWLCPDQAKRTQPRFGMGLLLVKVGNEIITPKEKVANDPAK